MVKGPLSISLTDLVHNEISVIEFNDKDFECGALWVVASSLWALLVWDARFELAYF